MKGRGGVVGPNVRFHGVIGVTYANYSPRARYLTSIPAAPGADARKNVQKMIELEVGRRLREMPITHSIWERLCEVLRRVRPSDRSENGPEEKNWIR